ncbi:DUF1800 domain-containing protein [Marimonas arenosa]|uniref:DUF1800 domain-containing protein n=1 Tax=Marimonas arenosa TaxID=1795305 RepID=A0AAE4B5Y8_9RHOB|nr:DUF1800 domain-containing protein [Marimonas arenosa]MDQ2090799.1 DUF1800 domain-containing protein [Marimonas arenosa]
MQDIASFIALNRFGLGPAPGEAEAVMSDPRGWIAAQIALRHREPAELAGFESSEAILAAIHTARVKGDRDTRKTTNTMLRKRMVQELLARARAMIATPVPFAERMVLFWSNHFTVSATKGLIAPALPAYEREAIRPHIFGRFSEMLVAAIRHPVMLSYLDNAVSLGENSPAGQRRRQTRGSTKTLNENLAREILELHTLGVNGGYTQADVIELAKVLTGWGHGGVRGRNAMRPVHGGFEFRPGFHEPGPKTLLGRTYPEDGDREGLAVLSDLARHPSTAQHIATKLVRHFVSDDPPADAVDRIAQVFLDSDGDLAEVSRGLIELDAVWAEPLPKVKTHYELVISAHRVTGEDQARRRDVLQPLREFDHLPFTAPSPAGWGDRATDWIAPEALMRRIEWLRRFSGSLPATLYPDQLLDQAIGPVVSDDTRLWVSRAPSGDAAIAMILASPEFQRR